MKKRKGVLEVGSQSWLLSGGWGEMVSQTGIARTEQQWHPLLWGTGLAFLGLMWAGGWSSEMRRQGKGRDLLASSSPRR